MVLRRIAAAIDRRPRGYQRRRAILSIAASDFLAGLKPRRGKRGGAGYSGRDLSRIAEPAFWAMLLLSQRRERFAMTLVGQIHRDTAAVRPYVQEKKAAAEILRAIPGIDADSLVGFVDIAIEQFQPAGASGAALVPLAPATEILKAALLRGAMVGELRPEAAEVAWLASHGESRADPERHWRTAQDRAEGLYQAWVAKRRKQKRRLI